MVEVSIGSDASFCAKNVLIEDEITRKQDLKMKEFTEILSGQWKVIVIKV